MMASFSVSATGTSRRRRALAAVQHCANGTVNSTSPRCTVRVTATPRPQGKSAKHRDEEKEIMAANQSGGCRPPERVLNKVANIRADVRIKWGGCKWWRNHCSYAKPERCFQYVSIISDINNTLSPFVTYKC